MYAYLNGVVADKGQNTLVIDVNGVGYLLSVSMNTLQETPPVGEKMKVYTHFSVREDAVDLFGFATQEEKSMFTRLLTVSGIGPKVALSILGAIPLRDLTLAIITGDITSLSRAPGIGKKTAERLILDLRDKISSAYAVSDDPEIAAGGIDRAGAGGRDAVSEESSPASDAVEALVALGYMRAEAARAVKKCAKQNDTGAILQEALRYL